MVQRVFEKVGKVHKVKLYHHSNTTQLKGDALVTFINEDSVPKAVEMFNGHEIRTGCIIMVAPADFGAKNNASVSYYG